MNDVELAWLAGLFEAEGSMSLGPQGRPTCRLAMTDEDVVRRAQAMAGVGSVKRSLNPTVGGKWMWNWGVGRCDDAARLIELMLPYFGARRTARAREVLASYSVAAPPKRLRTHCKHGHALTPENVRIEYTRGTSHRACRECATIRVQAYRERHPERARDAVKRHRAKLRETAIA